MKNRNLSAQSEVGTYIKRDWEGGAVNFFLALKYLFSLCSGFEGQLEHMMCWYDIVTCSWAFADIDPQYLRIYSFLSQNLR